MTDFSSLKRTIQLVEPDEIYNLAAQSHVAVSFEQPEYTVESDALGPLRMLEAIRSLGPSEQDALLPGINVRDVWQGAGSSPE